MKETKKRLKALKLKSMDVKTMSDLRGGGSTSFEVSWSSTVTSSMEVESGVETESYTEFYY